MCDGDSDSLRSICAGGVKNKSHPLKTFFRVYACGKCPVQSTVLSIMAAPNRPVRYEYDGGVLYLGGDCGLCLHPFNVAVTDVNDIAQQCIDHNACPTCLRRIRNRAASRQLSVREWRLSRHCANLACCKLFRASYLPRTGEIWTEFCCF